MITISLAVGFWRALADIHSIFRRLRLAARRDAAMLSNFARARPPARNDYKIDFQIACAPRTPSAPA